MVVLCRLRPVRCPCLTSGPPPGTLGSAGPTSRLPPWYVANLQIYQLICTPSQKSRTRVSICPHSGSHGSSQRVSSSGSSRFVGAAGRSDRSLPSTGGGHGCVLVSPVPLPPGGTQRAPVGAPGPGRSGEDSRRSRQPGPGQSGETAVQQRE